MLHAVNNVLVFVLAGALGDGVATEERARRRRPAVPAGQRAVAWPPTCAGGAVAAPAAARDRAPRRWTCGRRAAPVPVAGRLTRRPGVGATGSGPVGYRLLRRREVPTHGVWGNWQPDGFWFR